MAETSLKGKATRGILWSFVDQIATQGMGFLIGIVLARILLPADYGLIGMLGIFLSVANSFVESGFTQALIQKTDRTDVDFSTVFYSNLGVGTLFYAFLFIAAPWIASFYKVPLLDPLTKAMALLFVINSLSWVPRTRLMIDVDFKTQSKISIISVVLSGIIGIAMAYTGFGVWALVAQSLSAAASQVSLYWFFSRWKPLLCFSKDSFRRLFGYGSRIMATGLLNTIYNNAYMMVIGRVFSPAEVGYYSRAQGLQSLPSTNVTNVLQRVTFPIFCTIQNDNARLIAAYRKLIRLASFVTFPLMFLLVSIARPLIIVLLTEKWLPAVDLFQILCFAGMWTPIHAINLNILEAKGRSDLFLRLEFWKKIYGIAVLFGTIPFGLRVMVAGQAFYSFTCLFINTYYTGKYFDYGVVQQIKDILSFLLLAVLLSRITMFAIDVIQSHVLQCFVGTLLYGGLYVGAARLFKLRELGEVMATLLKPVEKHFPRFTRYMVEC